MRVNLIRFIGAVAACTGLVCSQVHASETQAFAAIRKVAVEFKDAGSQFLVGHMYYHGQGVEKNASKAAMWFEKAAKQNHVEARFYLGAMMVRGEGVKKNVKAGLAILQSVQQHVEAAYLMATLYDTGKLVKRDRQKAFQKYLIAAKQGDIRAQLRVGEMLSKGLGTAKNPRGAVYWWRKALQHQSTEAAYHLGNSYYQGFGVEQDFQKALTYFSQSANRHYSPAMAALGRMYLQGDGVAVDRGKAETLLQNAAAQNNKLAHNLLETLRQTAVPRWDPLREQANQGDPVAQYRLAIELLKQGGERPMQSAIQWFGKGALAGHLPSQLMLGKLYLRGTLIKRDTEKSVRWFRLAAEQNDAYAQYQLAQLYFHGSGVDMDFTQARYWANKAVQQSYSDADELLESIDDSEQQRSTVVTVDVPDKSGARIGGQVQADETDNALAVKAAAGSAQAQYELAMQLLRAEDNDYTKQALDYFLQAAEQGYDRAQIQLGHIYRFGTGVEQDYAIAARWYLKAAQQNNKEAQFQLGTLYAHWKGLQKSTEFAEKWYKKAAENGHLEARTALQAMQ